MAADPLTSRTVDSLLAEEIDFDFDDDPFADPKPPEAITRDDKSTLSPRKRKAGQDDPFGGNVDEEVKIVKQRAKIPKLDADRLCSKPGIPQIRQLVRSGKLKKKLRLKGKGHEFSDTARLLNYYQIWLDQLYPRAKFADALQLVEKAGHNKRMQMMRKVWIDEGKPWYSRREELDAALDAQELSGTNETASREQTQPQDMQEDGGPSTMFFGTDATDGQETNTVDPDDDELDLLLAQEHQAQRTQVKTIMAVESEGEDDLDALLADQENRKRTSRPIAVEDDQDDLDALLYEQEMDNVRVRDQTRTNDTTSNPSLPHDSNDDDTQDELDALLNDELRTPTANPITKSATTEEFNDDFEDEDLDGLDDLDALLTHEQKQPPSGRSEPELPPITAAAAVQPYPPAITEKEGAAPNSEEVPELDNMVSSSPIPNVRTDELDELMDEHDAKIKQRQIARTPQKDKDDSQLVEQFMSSSPIPNEN